MAIVAGTSVVNNSLSQPFVSSRPIVFLVSWRALNRGQVGYLRTPASQRAGQRIRWVLEATQYGHATWRKIFSGTVNGWRIRKTGDCMSCESWEYLRLLNRGDSYALLELISHHVLVHFVKRNPRL